MAEQKIVVIGASAGGVEALIRVTEGLPHDLNAPVLVVLHVSATAKSALPQILSRAQRLAATYPVDGQRLQPGRIYVAPPDWHMLVLDTERISLSRGPREHSCRPAIDPLFRSAAVTFGAGAIGIVLSGTLDDGTAGLLAIKEAGGTTIVQLPKDAIFPGMPLSAVEHVAPEHILPAANIGELVGSLVSRSVTSFHPPNIGTNDIEVAIDAMNSVPYATKAIGSPAEFGCPECGGTLWAIAAGNDERYRCRVGHAYSSSSLMDEQTVAMEKALWTAYRALREKADLAKRVAKRLKSSHRETSAERFARESERAEMQASQLLDLMKTQRQAEPFDTTLESLLLPSQAIASPADVAIRPVADIDDSL